MLFTITTLGTGSATPIPDRNPSAQIVQVGKEVFLVDCGEDTQRQILKSKIRVGNLNHIFISHLHGDHYFGLLGLLTSLNLNQRKAPLHVYAPAGLDEVITTMLRLSDTRLTFSMQFHVIETENVKVIFENEILTVETIPLQHRIPCSGFLFREKPGLRHIIPEKLPENTPFEAIKALKRGENTLLSNGKQLAFEEVTLPADIPRSYAYCSDTRFVPELATQLHGVTMLYHEATFADEHSQRATQTYHSTARQAAWLAKEARVGKLLLGHYSIRYKTLDHLLAEAREVFEETFLSTDGAVFSI